MPEHQKAEEWKDVPGYRGRYIVSNRGRVARVQKTRVGHVGYSVACLSQDGAATLHHVHSLVAAAFIGPRPLGMLVNHRSGIKTENHDSNLEYVSRSQNVRHAIETGLIPIGAEHHQAKLCPAEVIAVRLMKGVWSQSRLASIYKVSQGTIRDIQSGKIWRYINSPATPLSGQIGSL